jgi:hypothetical protein
MEGGERGREREEEGGREGKEGEDLANEIEVRV